MRLFALLFILFIFSITGNAQIADFYKEYITIEIKKSSVEINGVYQLRNPEEIDLEMNLHYPFPLDSMYGKVRNLYAFERLNDSVINRLGGQNEKGAMVELKIPAKSEKTLYIGYTQELLGNKAEYILTTTKKWKKPLESSEFELILPAGTKIDDVTYKAINRLATNNKLHYYFRETNFMPQVNFKVWFQLPTR